MTPEQRAYDLCNRVEMPGWGDEVTAAIAQAIRDAAAEAWVNGHNSAVVAMQVQLDDAMAKERERCLEEFKLRLRQFLGCDVKSLEQLG